MSVGKLEGYIRVSPDKHTWQSIPTPAQGSGTIEINTIVNGGRNITGDFIGETVGNDKCKINLSYGALDDDSFRWFMKLFDREHGGHFINYVEFYDPRVGQRVIREMYVGDRRGTPHLVDGTGRPELWLDVQCNLIEV